MKARGRPLTTVKGFIDRVEGFPLPDGHEFYFRGHSNKDKYRISPSVFRSEAGKSKEHALFRELIATNPGEFKDDSSTLERLARMQHHSCPTRLLDVSTNPLVALYFACKSSPRNHGEVIALRVDKETVKFFDSDTVSCVSNLARLSLVDKQTLMSLDETSFNDSPIAKRLLHFIKEEKPYFEPKINKHDLIRVLVVRPKLNSKRLVAQAGAFLVFGQVDEIDGAKVRGIDIERIIIDAASKPAIIKSLNSLGINEGTLFMDIDSYAAHLKKSHGV